MFVELKVPTIRPHRLDVKSSNTSAIYSSDYPHPTEVKEHVEHIIDNSVANTHP
jgi:hypothetical protein